MTLSADLPVLFQTGRRLYYCQCCSRQVDDYIIVGKMNASRTLLTRDMKLRVVSSLFNTPIILFADLHTLDD